MKEKIGKIFYVIWIIIGVVLLILIAIFLPLILTILVGIAFANMFGFTGIYWWAFVILFYIIICAILGALGK